MLCSTLAGACRIKLPVSVPPVDGNPPPLPPVAIRFATGSYVLKLEFSIYLLLVQCLTKKNS